VRLYLSSYGLGDSSDKLLSMLGDGRRAAVIANAMDPYADRGVDDEIAMLASIGIQGREVDLREGFDVDGCDLLWVRGGNVFVLRHAMAESGADRQIVDLLQRDAIVYAGYSAGPCVLSPTLRGLDLCDDPTEVDGEPTFDGLGILDFVFVPHFDTPGHPETNAMNDVVAYLGRENVPYRTFRDGEVLIVDGR
jgi:dipeptidase E